MEREEILKKANNDMLYAGYDVESMRDQFRYRIMNSKDGELPPQIKVNASEYISLNKETGKLNRLFRSADSDHPDEDLMLSTLTFNYSDKHGRYFLNGLQTSLRAANDPLVKSQYFNISSQDRTTRTEAYNMLSGRFVHKIQYNSKGESYGSWNGLNFKEQVGERNNYKTLQYHDNYGYDVRATLGRYPIKEMIDPKLADYLVRDLMRGNAQPVTMTVDGNEQRYFVSANPEYKRLNVYDIDMKPVKWDINLSRPLEQDGIKKPGPPTTSNTFVSSRNTQSNTEGLSTDVEQKNHKVEMSKPKNREDNEAKQEIQQSNLMRNQAKKEGRGRGIS